MIDDSLQARVAELEILQRRTEVIARINAALSTATDEQGILSAVADLAEQSGVAGSALAYAKTDVSGHVDGAKVVAMQLQGQALNIKEALPTDEFPLDGNPILRIALENPDEPLFVENMFTDPRTDEGVTREAFRYTGMTATVILWFRAAGRIQGVMTFNWLQEQPFNEEVRYVFKAIQPVAAAAIANRRLMLELEQTVGERTAELRESEERLNLAVNAANIGLWEWNLQTGGTLISDVLERMLGYEPGELRSSLDTLTSLVHPDDAALMQERLNAHLNNPDVPFEAEVRMTTKPGDWRWILASGQVIEHDAENNPVRIIGTLQDIHMRKQLQEEQLRMQQQVIDAQRQALAELSTPIIPIMDRIIVMPLVGGIDTGRSRDIMRSLLEGISRYRAQIAILDITGVPVVDSGVADHLNRTMQAARLKGAQTIITGVSDAVAETIVDLGIDWSEFETLRDLQTGLIMALERLGFHLNSTNGKGDGNGKSK